MMRLIMVTLMVMILIMIKHYDNVTALANTSYFLMIHAGNNNCY